MKALRSVYVLCFQVIIDFFYHNLFSLIKKLKSAMCIIVSMKIFNTRIMITPAKVVPIYLSS